MTLLFDISPEEPARRKKEPTRARKAAAHQADTVVAEKPPTYLRESPQRLVPRLGTIDHTYQCADGRCGAEFHDILHEADGEWHLECGFCGTRQWVEAIADHLKPKEQGFVLRDGRFAGLSLDEVEQEPRGIDYLKWAAASHPRKPVRDAVTKHMEGRA